MYKKVPENNPSSLYQKIFTEKPNAIKLKPEISSKLKLFNLKKPNKKEDPISQKENNPNTPNISFIPNIKKIKTENKKIDTAKSSAMRYFIVDCRTRKRRSCQIGYGRLARAFAIDNTWLGGMCLLWLAQKQCVLSNLGREYIDTPRTKENYSSHIHVRYSASTDIDTDVVRLDRV